MVRLQKHPFDLLNLRPVPFVPEVRLYQANDLMGFWEALDAGRGDLPYWAVPWVGGQAIARYILDHPATFAGRCVLDIGTAGGLCAIAAALAGAWVTACDVDPLAVEAARRNATANRVTVAIEEADLLYDAPPPAGVMLAGDLFYERRLAARIVPWLQSAAGAGTTIFVGDPGRPYLPAGLRLVQRYEIPVPTGLEDAAVKAAGVYSFPVDAR